MRGLGPGAPPIATDNGAGRMDPASWLSATASPRPYAAGIAVYSRNRDMSRVIV